MSERRSHNDVDLVIEALLGREFALELFGDLKHIARVSDREMKADCPFTGKHHKFYFSLDKPLWNSFTLGEGGDWFKYLRTRPHAPQMEFPVALEWLAERAGVQLRGQDSQAAQAAARRSSLIEDAHSWCRRQLAQPEGKPVLDYLTARGYTADEIRGMELGAYTSRPQLQHHLMGRGYTREEISGSGLLTGRFGTSHQLSLLWTSSTGRALGMACRALKKDIEPKYLYSRGLARSEGLLGLTRCRGRQEAVLVEGVLDALYLNHHSIPTCAAGGTVLTSEQRAMIARARIGHLVLCLDRDEAGQDATEKLLRQLYQTEGCPALYVATLPDGSKDPDELVRAQGPDAFRAVLGQAESAARWHGRRAAVGFDFSSDRGRDTAVAAAQSIGALIPGEQHRRDFEEAFGTASGQAFTLRSTTGAGGSDPSPPDGTASVSAAGGEDDKGKQKDRATFRESDHFGLTTDHDARRLAERIDGLMRFCPSIEGKLAGSGWLRWDGPHPAGCGAWRICDRGEIFQEARRVALDTLKRAKRDKDLGERAANLLGNWAIQCLKNKHYQTTLETQARVVAPELYIAQSELDSRHELVNLRNCVINLDTNERLEHDKGLLFTKTMPVDYDPAAECPRWLDFLTWAMTDPSIADDEQRAQEARAMVAFLARVLGYCLTGYTFLQVWFFNHGRARAGKSTFHRVLNRVFGLEGEGGYLEPASPELLLTQKGGGGSEHERRLARISLVRLVTLEEINKGARLDEAQLKRLTGEELVIARRLYNEEFAFQPRFKIMFAANTPPVIPDGDDATFRRIVLIPWPNQLAKENRDFDLVRKLQAEGSGIFNWMLDGWQDVQERIATGKDPLGPPPPVIRASRRYQSESDAVGQFTETCLKPHDSTVYKVPAAEVYKAFKEWAEEEGYPRTQVPGRNNFNTRMAREFEQRGWRTALERTGAGMTWVGLSLLDGGQQLDMEGGRNEEM